MKLNQIQIIQKDYLNEIELNQIQLLHQYLHNLNEYHQHVIEILFFIRITPLFEFADRER